MPDALSAALRDLAAPLVAAADELDTLHATLAETRQALIVALEADATEDAAYEARIAALQAEVARITALLPYKPIWDGYLEPTLLAENVVVPLNATHCWMKLTCQGTLVMTQRVRIDVRNGILTNPETGVRTSTNVGGASTQERIIPRRYATWWPGDDPDLYVRFDLSPVTGRGVEGNFIDVMLLPPTPDGFRNQGGTTRRITFSASAPPVAEPPPTRHRRPMLLSLAGAPRAVMDPATVVFSNTGFDAQGRPCFMDSLESRRREQTGNGAGGEDGFYAPYDPARGTDGPIQIVNDRHGVPILRLHAGRLAAPVTGQSGKVYTLQAAAINSMTMPEWKARYGCWGGPRRLPAQNGCWTGDWVIMNRRDRLGHAWPGEIDFQEHDKGWSMSARHTSVAIHWGNFGSNVQIGADGRVIDLHYCGFPATLNQYTHYHDKRSVVTRGGWVHVFFDGVEIHCMKNFAIRQDGAETFDYLHILDNAVVADPPADFPTTDCDYDIRRYELHEEAAVTMTEATGDTFPDLGIAA